MGALGFPSNQSTNSNVVKIQMLNIKKIYSTSRFTLQQANATV